jgi:uncharacterized protein (TIRG00374 family)
MLRGKRGLFLTSLGLIIFVAYLAYSDPFSVLIELGRFDLGIFVLALLVNYLGLFFFSTSWYLLLRSLEVGVSLLEAIQAMFVSLFVVWLVPIPVGTEIIRAYLVKDKKNSDMGKAIASVVVHKAFYNIAFGFLISIATIMVTIINGNSIPTHPELVVFVIFFAVVSSTIYGLFLDPNLLLRVYDLSPRWIKKNVFDRMVDSSMREKGFPVVIGEIDSAVKSLMTKPADNLFSLIMVAFHWSTGSLTAYIVALSLGWPIDFWVVVLVYALIEFIQQLNVFIPGGLGIIDATLTGAFVLLGVPLSIAAAISLLTRLATYWFELILCGLISLQYGFKESLKDYLN